MTRIKILTTGQTGASRAASATTFTPASGVAATNVQAAIVEVATDVTDHLNDTVAAHAATAVSFSPTGTIAATTVQAAIAELDSEGLAVYNVVSYGADATGATDSTSAILAADAACEAAGGGIVWFPAGTYRCDSQLTLSTDGGSPVPKFKARAWMGAGSWMSGKTVNSAPNGGAIIDMRNNANAGLFLNAEGHLGLTGVTFTQLGTAHTQPMILVTNTTAHIIGCSFYGHTSKNTTTCDQDAVVFGGTTTTIGSATSAPFQGYGTKVENCHFNKIRRGVYGRSYSNAIKVIDNTWWAGCGGATAIEFDGGGDTVNYSVGGTITGNLIECVGYTKAMTFTYTNNFYLAGNDFYDNAAIVGAYISLGTGATYNTIIAGHYVAATPLVTAVNNNTIIDMNQSQTTTFTQPVAFPNTTGTNITQLLVSKAQVVQSAASVSDATELLHVKRSAAEASNPGTTVFRVQQHGLITVGGDQAGGIDFKNAAGTTVASFTGSLKNWVAAGSGGAMSIDTGSGGSYFTLRSFGFKLLDYLGTNTVTMKVGSGSPEGAFAAPVGSVWFRVDGGAGTSMYVKESGSGNTGWVGK